MGMCKLPPTLNNVVIVEDEIIISRVFEVYFQNADVHVIKQYSKAEDFILEMKQNNEVDIVLMDVQLGGKMDGIEAAKAFRKISNVPILFTTGNEYNESCDATELIPNSKILNKPIHFEKLCKAINEIYNDK